VARTAPVMAVPCLGRSCLPDSVDLLLPDPGAGAGC